MMVICWLLYTIVSVVVDCGGNAGGVVDDATGDTGNDSVNANVDLGATVDGSYYW